MLYWFYNNTFQHVAKSNEPISKKKIKTITLTTVPSRPVIILKSNSKLLEFIFLINAL